MWFVVWLYVMCSLSFSLFFFFSSRRRHTSCALVTGVQTCALPIYGAAVDAILKATKNPVQLGGGIRTLDHIENWLSRGLARVILGTVAVRDPALVIAACKRFPGKIEIGRAHV